MHSNSANKAAKIGAAYSATASTRTGAGIASHSVLHDWQLLDKKPGKSCKLGIFALSHRTAIYINKTIAFSLILITIYNKLIYLIIELVLEVLNLTKLLAKLDIVNTGNVEANHPIGLYGVSSDTTNTMKGWLTWG